MFVFFQVHKSLWCGCEFIFGTFFFLSWPLFLESTLGKDNVSLPETYPFFSKNMMLAHCAEQHGFAIIASMATHIHVFLSKARFWPLTGCHESNMCFLWYHGHFFPNCKLIHSPILLSFHFLAPWSKFPQGWKSNTRRKSQWWSQMTWFATMKKSNTYNSGQLVAPSSN